MKNKINIANESCEDINIGRKRKCMSLGFAIVNIAIFITFIVIFTFGRNLLSAMIVPGVTWGVVVEPALIVIALVMSLAYYILVSRLDRNIKGRSNEHYH